MPDRFPDIPKQHIRIDASGAQGPGKAFYVWEVTMKASDATGIRILPYRASGWVDGDGGGFRIDERGLQVRDENRPVWTAMNATDRRDIREIIARWISLAIAEMRRDGKNSYELLKR